MDILSTVVIAVGLSMDCFAVAIASAASNKNFAFRHSVIMALFFGAFQGGMAFLGWLLGMGVSDIIGSYDHWIAFGLLSFVGVKMIKESFELEKDGKDSPPIELIPLTMLSLATSIDAFAVGATFGILRQMIILPSILIASICLTITLCGAAIGARVGHLFEGKIEIFGGIVLIGIGLKMLLEHIF